MSNIGQRWVLLLMIVTVSLYSQDQQKNQELRVGRLYRLLIERGSPSIIMDDEAYFKLSGDQLPCNQYYYAHAAGDAPDEQKFRFEK